MLKKFLLLILLIVNTSCGYEATNSKKKLLSSNFSINQLIFYGDREINRKLKQQLSRYMQTKNIKIFDLEIESDATKTIVSKDSKGNAKNFNLNVDILIKIKRTNHQDIKLLLNESFKYNNNEDKFELQRYEQGLKNNLSEIIVRRIVSKLSNIQ
jgi:outer membrane lipopolysaccharide assembly protein LptE/RlpB